MVNWLKIILIGGIVTGSVGGIIGVYTNQFPCTIVSMMLFIYSSLTLDTEIINEKLDKLLEKG